MDYGKQHNILKHVRFQIVCRSGNNSDWILCSTKTFTSLIVPLPTSALSSPWERRTSRSTMPSGVNWSDTSGHTCIVYTCLKCFTPYGETLGRKRTATVCCFVVVVVVVGVGVRCGFCCCYYYYYNYYHSYYYYYDDYWYYYYYYYYSFYPYF